MTDTPKPKKKKCSKPTPAHLEKLKKRVKKIIPPVLDIDGTVKPQVLNNKGEVKKNHQVPTKTNPTAGGRPTIMTDEVLIKLETAFSVDATVREACIFAGISEAPYYNYVKDHPEFKEKVENLRAQPILKCRQNVMSAINSGDRRMSRWYLERKNKQEFSTRVEAVGKDGEKLMPDSVNNLPDIDSLKEVIDKIRGE